MKMDSHEKASRLSTSDAVPLVVGVPQLLCAADLAQNEGENALAIQLIEAIYWRLDQLSDDDW